MAPFCVFTKKQDRNKKIWHIKELNRLLQVLTSFNNNNAATFEICC